MKKFKIACIQINATNNIEKNISKIDNLINKATELKADIIFLPENAFFMPEDHENLLDNIKYEEENSGLKFIRNKSQELNKWINIGSVAIKSNDSNLCYNRCYLINNKGNISSTYNKIHLFDAEISKKEVYRESKMFTPGNKAVVAKTDCCNIGLSICYDLRFPHLFRHLAHSGAEILSIPAAFIDYTGNLHWHTLLRARAIENTCYVVATAQTGTHYPSGRKSYGHSMVVDPMGHIIAELNKEEDVLIAEIDMEFLYQTRKQILSLTHDRDFT